MAGRLREIHFFKSMSEARELATGPVVCDSGLSQKRCRICTSLSVKHRNGRSVRLGDYRGRHYTEWVEEVKAFKRAGRLDEAVRLLLTGLVEAVEAEATRKRWGPAPWYYDQLAIIHRKKRDYAAEIAILELYAEKNRAHGGLTPGMAKRKSKACALNDANQRSPP